MSNLDSKTSGGLDRSTDTLGDAFYPLFQLIFDEDGEFVADIEEKLQQARMPDTVELYLSRALAIGVLVGLALWLVGMAVGYGVFALGLVSADSVSLGIPVGSESTAATLRSLAMPAAVVVSGLVFGSLGFAGGFGTLVAIPYSTASARKREINMLLSDSISFMYALSVGGLNQLEILEAMARAEDTYGEVSREFQSIVQETEYFGTDYRNAIRQQAILTPSDDLSQFLTDMLSIVNSGGNMQGFLDDKKDKHLRTAKQQQEQTLETMELFGEMYMTLSLFPLLLIIILVIMSMLGEAQSRLLYATVYGLIPLTGVGFLVLVSTVKQDEIGDGFLSPEDESDRLQGQQREGLVHMGLVESYVGEFSLFSRIKSREGTFKTKELLRRPHLFFKRHPLFTLALTVPAALSLLAVSVVEGAAPTTWDGMVANPVWGTFIWFYVPVYLVAVPLAVFHEWNVHSRSAITGKLSDNLRKLSSANDTGQTLLESIKTVSDTSSGKLADEFEVMYAKVHYGMSLREALVEFNNKYHIPRLARTVKLITKAQEASSQITEVLTTAAQASENQDDIERERISRTRMQVAIILMTYVTLLAVMAILKTQFLDVMAGLSSQASSSGGATTGGPSFGGGIDPDLLSLLFFHGVTIQAMLSGFISGYIRNADLLSGVKFVVILQTLSLAVWMVVG
ncbi:flagella assembly protein j [Haloferax sp. Atlit-10N]|uniref:Type IV pilus biogenesis complex membrane subunit n=1 Tax=Haloferax prahovense (strain DSM 18310 / JCM 13924 / TL6) TaxID=1227461 RepID=M0GHA5_HALPT|nr:MULTISPECIES: type II secretion system F family protein [Haloferax]ELZ71595.1 type IV pilus biogenesis complex membrane subunit [Haloferax prahovense DSM 18310]RDZ45829.1 flagella assembly protein j [Haloferax sp. Atlit-19N]RDZ46898.1 flagella assembly protein j [Haloferax sp. Atlit-16N]RDZ60730.1 flagella assembly protein j [Haloferax sp. Atlit-10N]